MKKLLEVVGFTLFIQGVAGLVFHFVGWFDLWTFVHRLAFLSGHEVLANAGLVVLGGVVMVLSDQVAKAR